MRIRELTPEPIPSEMTDFELTNQEPSQEDVDTVKDFVDTIEHLNPQQALTRLQQLQQEYPTLDRILDLIPQTRLVKNVALAVDSLVAKRPLDALTHLGQVVGGTVATAASVANTAQSLAKGDYTGAARQAFGATQIGRDFNRGQQMVQRFDKATQALANPQQTYTDLKNRILPQQEPAPVDNKTDELERVRKLSGI